MEIFTVGSGFDSQTEFSVPFPLLFLLSFVLRIMIEYAHSATVKKKTTFGLQEVAGNYLCVLMGSPSGGGLNFEIYKCALKLFCVNLGEEIRILHQVEAKSRVQCCLTPGILISRGFHVLYGCSLAS
jgi:hypothetical protein|mmetsp:Transcript_8051/g.12132  ORF Transcript_8051/g.12132 Transcript_8051/m.12132 type:complete len:127 (+) Transcript_8051:618-998(+)